jgi:hypothetical protein
MGNPVASFSLSRRFRFASLAVLTMSAIALPIIACSGKTVVEYIGADGGPTSAPTSTATSTATGAATSNPGPTTPTSAFNGTWNCILTYTVDGTSGSATDQLSVSTASDDIQVTSDDTQVGDTSNDGCIVNYVATSATSGTFTSVTNCGDDNDNTQITSSTVTVSNGTLTLVISGTESEQGQSGNVTITETATCTQ